MVRAWWAFAEELIIQCTAHTDVDQDRLESVLLESIPAGYPAQMAQPGLIVIGSGPAGVSAAEAFRAHKGDVPVRILTADAEVPYARPPLSKDYLRGGTEDVQLHPAQWYDDRSIELINDLHVDRIDLQSLSVRVDGAAVRWLGLPTWCLALANTAAFGLAFVRCADIRWEGPTGVT